MKIARRHPIRATEDGVSTASRKDRGQALVELALVLPILLLLLLGAAEFAQLEYAAIEVSNAARAGAAYGAQSPQTAAVSNYGKIQLAATSDAANLTSLTATATSVCACSTGGSLDCTNTVAFCPSPARVLVYVQVNTTANVAPLVHLPFLPKTFTLNGQAIMRVEQ